MTVGELIEKLRQYPMDAPVVTDGFDGFDLDDVDSCGLIPVYYGVREPGYCGQHIFKEKNSEYEAESGKLIDCVYIGRGTGDWMNG